MGRKIFVPSSLRSSFCELENRARFSFMIFPADRVGDNLSSAIGPGYFSVTIRCLSVFKCWITAEIQEQALLSIKAAATESSPVFHPDCRNPTGVCESV